VQVASVRWRERLRDQDRPGLREAAPYARARLRGLADGSVVHHEIVADPANNDLTAFMSDPDLQRNAMALLKLAPPARGWILHLDRALSRPDGVVLVRDRCAEEPIRNCRKIDTQQGKLGSSLQLVMAFRTDILRSVKSRK